MRAYLPRLAAQWPTGAAHRTVAGALVFVDVSGFTALSERLAAHGREGAEELTRLINDVHGSLVEAAVGLGGDIVKFGGDAELVLFTGDDRARRAAVAVARMQATLAQQRVSRLAGPVQLSMTSGLHVGEFEVAAVHMGHRELVVYGPDVSETVRCESSAPSGRVVVSGQALAALPDEWLAEPCDRGRLLDTESVMSDAGDLRAADEPVAAIDDQALAAWVPVQLAEALDRGLDVGDHRTATVGFVSLAGTDALADTDDRGVAVMQRVSSVVGEEAAQRNVTVLATDVAPDAVKYFLAAGAPIATERGAEAMLQAALAMLRRLPDVDLRIGVHRARVFAGNVGAPDRHTYAVQGLGTNLAARLCGSAERGQLAVMRGTATPAVFACTPRPAREFKGIDGPVMTEVVTGAHDEHEAVPDRSTPFVGRGREVGLLAARAGRAFGGTGQVTLVAGPPGSGKTRLLLEVQDAVDPPRVIRDGARATEAKVPYALVGRILRRLLDLEPTSDPTQTGDGLLQRINEIAPDLAAWTPLLAMPLSAVVPPTPQVADVAREHRRDRMLATVVELLERLLRGPTLLVLEDLHWVDAGSRVLIERLADRCPDHPWYLVVTSRSTQWSPGGDVIELDRLQDEAVSDLVDAVAASSMLPEARAEVLRRADGNPLFAIGLTRAGTSTHKRPGDVAYPDSLEELVARRIDELERTHALMLRDASVVGVFVDLDLLDQVLDEVVADLDVDVLEPGEWEPLDEFVELPTSWEAHFRQDTYRDVAYEGLSFEARRQLHRAVANVLRAETPEDDAQALAVLAHHYACAEDHAAMWDVGRRAGAAALNVGATDEATDLLLQAVNAADRLESVSDHERSAAIEMLGDAAEMAGRLDLALESYRRACEGQAATRVAALAVKSALVQEHLGDMVQALATVDAALASLNVDDATTASESEPVIAALKMRRAGLMFRIGDYEAVMELGAEAERRAAACDQPALQARALLLLDSAADELRIDHWEYGRGLPLYTVLGDQAGIARTRNNLGVIAYYEGRWDEALQHYEAAEEAAQRGGDVVAAAMYRNNIGEVNSDRARYDDAAHAFDHSLQVWKAAKYEVGIAVVLANRGRLATRTDDHGRAQALLDEAHSRFVELGAAAFVAGTEVRRAELALAMGDPRAAEETLVRVLDAEPPPTVAAEASYVMAVAMAVRGEHPEALERLRRAVEEAEQVRLPYVAAVSSAAASEIARAMGDPSAREHRRAAREGLRRLGITRMPRLRLG